MRIKPSIFRGVVLSLLACALFASPAHAAQPKPIKSWNPAETAPNTPMSDADFIMLCGSGSLQQVKDAIKNGANVKAKGFNGRTPLMAAVESNSNPEVVTVLIKAGADVSATKPMTHSGKSKVITEMGDAVGVDEDVNVKRAAKGRFIEPIEPRTYSGNTKVITSGTHDADFIELCKRGSLQQIKDAIKNGADVDAIINGWTPLIAAVSYNRNPEVVRVLIEADADVNVKGIYGWTPLAAAQQNKNLSIEVISALIKAGANVNAKDKDGWTPLIRAIIYDSNPIIIKAFIEAGADVNAKDNDEETPLMQAAKLNRNLEVVAALIKAGADINAKTRYGEVTLLMRAAGNNSNPEVIAALIKAGADVNAKDNNGRTPLIWAAGNSNPEVMTVLIRAGADKNAKTNYGETAFTAAERFKSNSKSPAYNVDPSSSLQKIRGAIKNGVNANNLLMPAVRHNNDSEVIAELIGAGADINARDKDGKTPLITAAARLHCPIGIITVLIKAGADVNAIDKKGWTPLMYAERLGQVEITAALVEVGAVARTAKPREYSGDTKVITVDDASEAKARGEFYSLCMSGSLQQIKDAIKNGANVNAKDNRNQTPLMWAARYNRDPEVVKALIEAGARVNERDNDGMTSLIYAITAAERLRYQMDIISALIKGGADVNAKGGRNGWTPLIWAVNSYDGEKTIPALIEAGADVNAEDYNGRTLLFWLSSDMVHKEKILAAINKAGLNTTKGVTFIEICKQGSLQQVKDAIKKGADVNTKDNNGYTALMAAAGFNSDAKVTIALIKAGADVNAKDIQGFTPLDSALQNGNFNTKVIAAKVLIKAGADVNARNYRGRTPLMTAAVSVIPVPEIIAALIKAGADINAKDKDGKTALMHAKGQIPYNQKIVTILTEAEAKANKKQAASPTSQPKKIDMPRFFGWFAMSDADFIELCQKGSLQQIKDAIKKGANVNAKDDAGRTVLMQVAYVENSNLEVITALIKAGADVNAKDKGGYTPLMSAASHYNATAITVLIKAGADVNAKDNGGQTPLMRAAAKNPSPEVITAFIEAGADVNAKDNGGQTPLVLALHNSEHYNPEVIKLLIKSGADVNVNEKDNVGRTLLMLAVYRYNLELTTILIKAGADVNAKDNNDRTPLMWAASNQKYNPEVITALIKAGAKVNAKDKDGCTSLMYAVANKRENLIETLLKFGADPKIRDNSGEKAIDYVRYPIDTDVLRKLEALSR